MKTLSDLCRVCLAEKEELTDIFTFSNRLGVQIVNAILMCAPVHIMKHDGLPKTICNPCHIRLKVAYEFQTQALESENTLNVYLKNLQTNSVNFEDQNAVCCDKSQGEDTCTNDLEVCNVKIETFDEESHQKLEEQAVCNNSRLSIEAEENINVDNKCPEPHKRTYFGETIIRHVEELNKRVPSGEKLYQCEVCNKNIELSVLNKKIDSGENYSRCEDCDRRVNSEDRRKLHEHSYRCGFCGKSFTQLERLKAHRKIHSDEKNSLSIFEFKSEIVTIDEDDQCFQEEQEKCIEDPLNQETGYKSIGDEFYYRDEILEEANKLYQNTECLLRQNENTVEKITSKNPHSAGKLYHCKVCDKSFTQLSNLKAHRRIHSGETYQCDSCDKCFTKLHVLMIHRKTHTGEKPYQCDVCHKCFGRPDILKTHKRTHSDEKPYKCDVCHKGFKYLQVLTAHKRTHAEVKPYQCNVCSKYFTQLDSLITHNRTHSGEKPYQCDICNKCFTRSDIMRIHRRTHSGEKPYRCDVCNKCFTRMSILKVHKVKHNEEKAN